MPNTYVGRGLELEDAVADGSRLVNARLGGTLTVADPFLLAPLADACLGRKVGRLLSRLAATLLLILAVPVLLATALWLWLFRRGPVIHSHPVFLLPRRGEPWERRTGRMWSFAPEDERPLWCVRGVLLRFLPGLLSVVRGDIGFTGLPPRSPDEVDRLPSDWRALYLHCRAGLVPGTPAGRAEDPGRDKRYVTEAWYVAQRTWRSEAVLLLRYLGRSLLGFGPPCATDAS
jgi:hypothetical protein